MVVNYGSTGQLSYLGVLNFVVPRANGTLSINLHLAAFGCVAFFKGSQTLSP